jgi:hypothetical protein
MKRLHTILYISFALSLLACQISKKPTPPVKVVQKSANDIFDIPQTSPSVIISKPVEEIRSQPVAMTVGTYEVKRFSFGS